MGSSCKKWLLLTLVSKLFKSTHKDQKEVSLMKEIRPQMELVDLQKRIETFLKSVKISNEAVAITEDTENDQLIISAGELRFKGLYPTMYNDVFTLYLVDGTKKLDSGIDVEYIEAIVFKTADFTPYQYIIYRYPQTQTTYLVDDGNHKKGSITYYNSCPCGHGSCEMEITEPVMNPEAINLSELLDN